MDALSGQKKPKKNDKQYRMTERDAAILRYLADNRFGTIADIKRKFWSDQANRHHYRRLSALKNAGYVTPLLGDNHNILGYRLSKKATQWMKAQGVIDSDIKTAPFYRTGFDHDKKLLQLREIFESSPLVSEYQPEHIARAELARRHGRQEKRDDGYKVPDALFRLKTPRGTFNVALELECTRKSLKRYRRFIRALSTTPDADLTFIASDNSPIMLCIKNLLAEAREKDPFVKVSKRDNGFYFVSSEILLREGRLAIFEGEGKRFSLSSLEKEVSAMKDRA